MGADRRSKLLSFFKPFSRPSPSDQDAPPTVHDHEPSAPIPLGPQDIPLPQSTLGRGPSATLSQYTAISGLPGDTGHSGPVTRYPSFGSNRQSFPQTPARLPSHISLSTMGFGNSPFRIIACDTPVALPSSGLVTEFGQLDCPRRDEVNSANHPPPLGIDDGPVPQQRPTEMPTLASAIHIREAGVVCDDNKANPDTVVQARASTWRAMPRSMSMSRNSFFDSWNHSKSRNGSVAGANMQHALEGQTIDHKQETYRIRRKMSIDNLVHSISRRSQLFRLKNADLAPVPDGDSRRWTAVYSEASDDSLAARARLSVADTQSKGNRMVLPQMRSIRNKFTLTKRDSRRASVLDIGSGRNGSPIRVSAMFQGPGDTARTSGESTNGSSRPLELSDVQDTVEINRSPSLIQPPSSPSPAFMVVRHQPAAAASALTLPMSPARDDISILDPSRTPMLLQASTSIKSVHPTKGNILTFPQEDQNDQKQANPGGSFVMANDSSVLANGLPIDPSSMDRMGADKVANVTASDSLNVIPSTLSSVRTMSELTSTDSSESLAARMRQSLSELKSAFKRMRNMSELDLSSIDGSRRTSGHDEQTNVPALKNVASIDSTLGNGDLASQVDKHVTRDIAHARSMSSTKMGAFMSPSESLAGTDGKMSCAPSGTSWHTAKEDLHVSYGSLAGLAWRKG